MPEEIPIEDQPDEVQKAVARAVMEGIFNAMREDGQILHLSDEEIRMIRSFRKFKETIKKSGKVFTWQTVPEQATVPTNAEAPAN